MHAAASPNDRKTRGTGRCTGTKGLLQRYMLFLVFSVTNYLSGTTAFENEGGYSFLGASAHQAATAGQESVQVYLVCPFSLSF